MSAMNVSTSCKTVTIDTISEVKEFADPLKRRSSLLINPMLVADFRQASLSNTSQNWDCLLTDDSLTCSCYFVCCSRKEMRCAVFANPVDRRELDSCGPRLSNSTRHAELHWHYFRISTCPGNILSPGSPGPNTFHALQELPQAQYVTSNQWPGRLLYACVSSKTKQRSELAYQLTEQNRNRSDAHSASLSIGNCKSKVIRFADNCGG
jgi:hypothetical protein